MRWPGSDTSFRGSLRSHLPPPLHEPRHLVEEECVEPTRLLQPPPCRGVRADGLDLLPHVLLPAPYSKGNRQKVALVAALASDAELLLLDEPTSGLDPLMEAAFRGCIEEEQRSGRTVLLSSHILSEVEALCDRVTIIRDGNAVESGTLSDLRHLSRTSISAELARTPVGLDGLPDVHGLRVEGNRVRCQVDASGIDGLLGHLTPFGVRSLISRPPTLEDLFLRHYETEGRDAESADRAGVAR